MIVFLPLSVYAKTGRFIFLYKRSTVYPNFTKNKRGKNYYLRNEMDFTPGSDSKKTDLKVCIHLGGPGFGADRFFAQHEPAACLNPGFFLRINIAGHQLVKRLRTSLNYTKLHNVLRKVSVTYNKH